jgi:CDP-diacylglycerol--serine O-phosphatidyltransferase
LSEATRRGWLRYLPPNLATLGSIVLGWLAITRLLMGNAMGGAWLGLWGIYTDRLDGLLARALDARSEFGVQLDSLADLVVFGMAPAAIAFSVFSHPLFHWSRWPLGVVCGVYLACAAIRLARYNVGAAGARKDFSGFPTTMVAAFLYTFMLSLPDLEPRIDERAFSHSWLQFAHAAHQGAIEALLPWCPLVVPLGALAMIAPLRVPRLGKPPGVVLGIGLGLVVVAAVSLTALQRFPEYGVIMLSLWTIFCLIHHARTREHA